MNFGLLPTLIEPAQEGEFDIFFFLLSDTAQMESLFAFIATHPLLLVDTISVDEPITNVLHFKVLGKLHSKEENIKWVRVMVWVDLRSRPQVGSFFPLHLG